MRAHVFIKNKYNGSVECAHCATPKENPSATCAEEEVDYGTSHDWENLDDE